MIKVGIIGGSGYTAGELLRLLAHHSEVLLDFVFSTTNAGSPIYKQHPDLIGEIDQNFTDTINPDVDVLFLCLGHGRSRSFLKENSFSSRTKVIDLGNDFRLKKDKRYLNRDFVYGLPELQRENIQSAKNIANPGCFATAIQLALLPLALKNEIVDSIHINATTGSTGAGVMPGETTHFSWRDNNFSSYKVFTHQHLDEIEQSLNQLQEGFKAPIFFIPNRGNFSKGIYATVYTKFEGDESEVIKLYKDFYKDAKFTIVSDEEIHLKQVVNTNKCILHISKKNGMLLITSVIDNLIKGASGQAIHNMNLMFGLEEKTGLELKASAF
ncbi:N-acetyl-gamma-glutamyl-phosphate reductase [Aquimarina sp. 2201CG5-10]|uniref:N-acetyl-gamma-glutamyl-phosphate reductase n=1 Tax=Aquimarina callyspongiae TaxID=3098150 RepID=UPI002AB5500E|nr:N-acetyl-gamma-glutamyl-phosphate reductase [Aquimarina sp. 2201CG5-10]MDY8138054.1 N-acetyl-gamma-glutamyl-phosphate reductase [Aquimarina sp. 2201CG5-10]